ncbi:hypothetical protein NG829_19870 [Xanthomonas sacchari]|uniref:hypothetical protein n=1 Tax=Xanthomonas sacchari TaxID=56458 RepID=UPI00225DFDB9|nr:hypothetical protein [Xanthomonas sacchari]UYK80562.1 hypothetical protein NG829_19870 [Xanthomonas sacchari]
MSLSRRITPLLLALAAGVLVAPSAPAREHTRTRTAGGAEGARHAAVQASASGAHGSVQRARQWQADGSATRQGRAERNADGSASRQGSASVQRADGASASSSGSLARAADGTLSGSRQSSVDGTQGSYQGSTSVQDGSIVHTGTCTDASGAVVPCRP